MTGEPAARRVTLVLGTSAGGTGAHVRMLAAGLAGRGVGVSVAGPSAAEARFSFSAVPGVSFAPAEIGGRPRPGDLAVIRRLRRLLLGPAGDPPGGASPGVSARGAGAGEEPPPFWMILGGHQPAAAEGGGHGGPGAHVVHAHGLRAGALTVLALPRARGRRPGIVVTVHNAPPPGAVARLVYRLLERVTARGADLVLCVSPDLEQRMRAAGARRVERAVIAAPDGPPGPGAAAPALAALAPAGPAASGAQAAAPPAGAAASRGGAAGAGVGEGAADPRPLTVAAGRPMVLAAGRLAPQKDFGLLLEAAAAWRDLDPMPLVVIAGDGPLAGPLRAQAVALDVAAVFLGHHGDIPRLLATAAVFVLPSRWEGQPLVLQEALRAGTPVVATRAGGVPALAGEDAALLVPPGDAPALAAAVRSVLTDAPLAARLRAAAAARAAGLPAEADAVAAALAAYASLRPRPSSAIIGRCP
jgi:glycosyltransferase involved in cell wall biosynthesis